MATDPSISLQVRPQSVQSPLDAMQKAVSVADMISLVHERQQVAKQRAAEAPLRAAANAAAMDKLKEESTLKSAFDMSVKYNEETGDIDYDVPRAAQYFQQQRMPHLMDTYQAQIDKNRTEHRTQAINETKAHADQLAIAATPAENFLELPEDQKKAAWPDLRTKITALDRAAGKVLPYDYDAAVIDPKLTQIIQAHQQTLTVKQKLEQAQDRAKLQNIEDDKLSIEELYKKNGGTGPVPQQFRDKVIAARAGITAPAASTYTQETALRKLGLKIDPAGGDPIPLREDEMSAREKADLKYRQAGADLRAAQEDAATAKAELDRTKSDPNSPQYKRAQANLEVAQQNAKTAQDRLGIERDEAADRKQRAKDLEIEKARTNADSMIKAAGALAGSEEARKIWDIQRSHHDTFDIGPYERTAAPTPAKPAVPAAPATVKTATKAQVQAAATKAKIPYATLKARIEASGGKVIE